MHPLRNVPVLQVYCFKTGYTYRAPGSFKQLFSASLPRDIYVGADRPRESAWEADTGSHADAALSEEVGKQLGKENNNDKKTTPERQWRFFGRTVSNVQRRRFFWEARLSLRAAIVFRPRQVDGCSISRKQRRRGVREGDERGRGGRGRGEADTGVRCKRLAPISEEECPGKDESREKVGFRD